MKKTECLTVRVDADTLAALKRHCDAQGISSSELLRGCLARELAARATPVAPTDASSPRAHSLAPQPHEVERKAFAKLLAGLLLTLPKLPNAGTRCKNLPQQRHRVSELVEALLLELVPVGHGGSALPAEFAPAQHQLGGDFCDQPESPMN